MTNTNRYEVTARMPLFTHLLPMDILYPMVHPFSPNVPFWGKEEDKDNPLLLVSFCPDYPHLFRLLKWWEHVPVDELPKYVKWVDGNDVEYFKVKEWLLIKNETPFEDGRLFTAEEIDEDGDDYCYDFAYNYDGELYPATEAEYTDYITKLNAK